MFKYLNEILSQKKYSKKKKGEKMLQQLPKSHYLNYKPQFIT